MGGAQSPGYVTLMNQGEGTRSPLSQPPFPGKLDQLFPSYNLTVKSEEVIGFPRSHQEVKGERWRWQGQGLATRTEVLTTTHSAGARNP